MILYEFKIALASAISLAVGIQSAQADTDNAYNAFLAALSALTVSSNSVVQGERNAGRLTKIRQSLATKLLAELNAPLAPQTPNAAAPDSPAATASESGFLANAIDEKYMLCNFRWETITLVPAGDLSGRDSQAAIIVDQLATVAAQNYLNSVLSQLKEITPPKATDIQSAIRQLFNCYQVKAPTGGLQPAKIKATRDIVKKSCEADLAEFETAFYGEKIRIGPSERVASAAATGLPSLSFLGPFGSAFDTVAGILAPVLVDLSNLIASGQQKQAVKDYLSDEQTKKALNVEGGGLGRTEF